MAIKTIQSGKQKAGRVARWALLLQGYNFVIEHKAGKRHSNADGLSRREYPPEKAQNQNDKVQEVVIVPIKPSNSSIAGDREEYILHWPDTLPTCNSKVKSNDSDTFTTLIKATEAYEKQDPINHTVAC